MMITAHAIEAYAIENSMPTLNAVESGLSHYPLLGVTSLSSLYRPVTE